jgi:hypothetical protein
MLRTTKKNLRKEQTNDKRALSAAITLLVFLILLPLSTLGQGDTGWYGPSETNWGFSDASGAFSDGNGYASAKGTAGCDYWDYGFSLEPGVQVVGIEVRLDARHLGKPGAPELEVCLTWNGGSNWTAAYSAAVDHGAEQTYILGGPVNEWGRDWNITDLGDSVFGVRITASMSSGRVQLDWVAVRVYYTSVFSMEILSGQQMQFPTITGPGMYNSVNNTTLQITSPNSWSLSDVIVWQESTLDGATLPEGFNEDQVAALLTRDYDDAYQVLNGAAGGRGQHTFDVAYRLDLTGDNLRYFLAGNYSLVIRYTSTVND